MGLIVAVDDDGNARGDFFWDDGEALGQLWGHLTLGRFT